MAVLAASLLLSDMTVGCLEFTAQLGLLGFPFTRSFPTHFTKLFILLFRNARGNSKMPRLELSPAPGSPTNPWPPGEVSQCTMTQAFQMNALRHLRT